MDHELCSIYVLFRVREGRGSPIFLINNYQTLFATLINDSDKMLYDKHFVSMDVNSITRKYNNLIGPRQKESSPPKQQEQAACIISSS